MQLNIGKKIKALRKNRNITQEELAEALNVSAQSVSKWENSISIPDVELLPTIARYFSITMDELFNYKIDSLNYKERFISFMVVNGVIKFGEFKLQSGRISPYIINSFNYNSGAQIAKLSEFYADCIRENNIIMDTIISDTIHDLPSMISTCEYLYLNKGLDVNYSILSSIGKKPEHSERLLMIKDTLTSGNTIKNALQKIKDETSLNIDNIIVAVDRMEKSDTLNKSARKEIEDMFGIKIYSIVNLDDIISAIENGAIGFSEYLEALKKYKNEYAKN